jgi:hypothetical protein
VSDFEISIRSNIKQIQKNLNALAYQQMPFALATGVTALAKLVAANEVKNMQSVFHNPSPFTLKAVRVIPARKGNPVATVFVMDKAAQYLEPYEEGGVHVLNSKALLNPKDIPLNEYGQLRKGTLAALKARSDIFIGPIKTKHGIINGVWQRDATAATITRTKAGKKVVTKARRGFNTTGALKLLIRFGDALPVKQKLGYRDLARKIVDTNLDREIGRALAKAIATAKG